MKKVVLCATAFAIALMIAFGSFAASNFRPSAVAFAQEGTAVATVTTQNSPPVQTTQEDDNGFPWGLLGLAGLAGLAGLRRQPEPVQRETIKTASPDTSKGASKIGIYDNPKK
jgi:MYXO-CTERM domain-containing protein